MEKEIRHNLMFCTEDGDVVTITTDKPIPPFDGRYIAATFETKEAYRQKLMVCEENGVR